MDLTKLTRYDEHQDFLTYASRDPKESRRIARELIELGDRILVHLDSDKRRNPS